MAELPVEPTALFERALTAGLSEPEAIVRRRAAERLEGFEELGQEAIGALVRVAWRDRDETVRASALRALGNVAVLVKEDVRVQNTVTLRGEPGVLGEILYKGDQCWLKLNRLPSAFENAKPVVAVPAALETEGGEIEWSGGEQGLVAAQDVVAGGVLEVHLGDVTEARRAQLEQLFARVYLLHRGGF